MSAPKRAANSGGPVGAGGRCHGRLGRTGPRPEAGQGSLAVGIHWRRAVCGGLWVASRLLEETGTCGRPHLLGTA